MLPVAHRLTEPASFRDVARRGRRSATPTLVVQVATGVESRPGEPATVGFVVGKAVGGAVVRNRVRRRLRHLVRPLVGQLPSGTRVVVRALPASSGVSSSELAVDLRQAWDRATDALRR